MDNKKKVIIAIIVFIFLGLTVFTFANPDEGENNLNGGNGTTENNTQNNLDNAGDTNTNLDDQNDDTLNVINQDDDNNNNNNDNNNNEDNSYENALNAVIKAENTIDEESYNTALDLVELVTNEEEKENLSNRLEVVKEGIDVKALVTTLETKTNSATNKEDMDDARNYRTDENVETLVASLTNETLKTDLQSKLSVLALLLDDEEIEINIEDGAILSETTTIEVEDDNEVTIELNEEQYNGDAVTDGVYTLRVTDSAFNTKTINFTVDTKAPTFNVEDGSKTNDRFNVVVEDTTLDYIEITDGTTTKTLEETEVNISVEGTYTLTAYDLTGRNAKITLHIDKSNPEITGAEDGKVYKEVTVTITDKFLKEVHINEESQEDITTEFVKTFDKEGTYTIVVKDEVGNENTITFTIDRTKPVIEGVTDGTYYNTDVTPVITDKNFKNATLKYNGTHDKSYKVGDTLTKEGTYTLVATDLAMNKTKLITFTIDKTLPTVDSTSQVYEEKEGGRIKTTVVFSETVEYPFDNLNWRQVSDTEYYTYFYRTKDYTINFRDKAGNENSYTLSIDKTAPVYSSLRIIGGNYYNENGNHIRYATNGTTIYVYTTFAEKLAVAPTVTLNDTVSTTSYLAKESEGSYIYAAKFVLNAEDGLKDGEVSIVVEGYADTIGNVGDTLTNDDITLASQKYVIIDKTPVKVTLSDGTLGNDPYKKLNVKLYDANTVTSVVINGTQLSHTGYYVDVNDGDAYTFLEGENVIVAKDKAGNVTTVTYVKDTKAPVAKSMAMSGGKLYKENGKVNWYVTNGGIIYVNLHFEEKLDVAPIVKLNGTVEAKLGTVKESGDIVIYSYSHKVNADDRLANGLVNVEVSEYADRAGNVGETLTNDDITLNSQKYVVVDKTPVKISVSNGSIGSNPYSKLNVKLHDANGVVSVVINGKKLSHTGYYVDVNDGDAYTFLEGENVIVAKDKAGNVTTVTYVKDITAPIIEIPGKEGLNKNEYRVEAGTEVSVKDVLATATDNYDNDVEVVITKADFLATKEHPERNVYGYDFSNGFDTTTVGRYNITYTATDDAGNSSTAGMMIVIKDTTAPVITIKGTEGRNNNELRVNQDDVVTLDDVTATVTDIVDGEKEIYPTKVTRYYPRETGKASHTYDATNGFDTSNTGYYIIRYEAVDEAGNEAKAKEMLLVVKLTKAPEAVDGEVNLYGNLTLTDAPLYNVNDNTEEVVFNGNGYTFTQKITSADSFQWTENGTRPLMSNLFSSSNGSKIIVNNLTLKGTTSSVMLGHYVKTNQGNFNTEFNNVNLIGLEVVSFSSNVAPAATVYGNATLNNTYIYGSKLSSLDTDPMWPVYDLVVVNYSNTTINGGKIGTVYTWAKAYMEFNGVEVDTITTSIRKTSDFKKGELVIGEGTTVNKIVINNANAVITIKAGSVVDTLDYNNIDDTNMTVVIEDGAVVKNIINKVEQQ